MLTFFASSRVRFVDTSYQPASADEKDSCYAAWDQSMRFLTGAPELLTPTQKPSSKMLAHHRAAAIAAAKRAVSQLEQKAIKVLVTGSLADNTFDLHSDIDFLVVECPREVKYALEGIVEDALGSIPFDVI